tara:strand:+ start:4983 stop:5321 length:339 start_codon:yes stop_codon:yes gene_type:complete
MNEILFLIILGLGIWFWQDALHARELAVKCSRRYCRDLSYQFLDESVAMTSIKPGRNFSGNFAFHRYYHFEFSPDGQNRFSGTAYVIGHHLESIQLDHPDGIILESSLNKKD